MILPVEWCMPIEIHWKQFMVMVVVRTCKSHKCKTNAVDKQSKQSEARSAPLLHNIYAGLIRYHWSLFCGQNGKNRRKVNILNSIPKLMMQNRNFIGKMKEALVMKWLLSQEMDTVTLFQMLCEAVCFSPCANTLEKAMIPTILLPAIVK